eukprot:CAMPEP_0172597986 /NCGR_PEP_ID=MMETSP1068-20121228/17969_1 /TAXON_ID=35684 /ORGANISM="Pseudopedinella elastica, Strain CCMP716" /LENGTH=417 /DNA_ID=CAMNT_0013397671 /DNA_START=98 /DNA_END=1351 /DNA_ORIENTATION=+
MAQEQSDHYKPEREVWRSQLMAALVKETEEGSVEQLKRIATAHPLCLHEFFTRDMTVWMLEDKTYPWYDFVGATAIFVASAYARVEVVRFLLDHGCNPTVECKFPGMDLHSETKTLNPLDVLAQYVPTCPAHTRERLTDMLKERNVLKAPPMPSMSMKCAWHEWYEMIPYFLARFKEGDQVMCQWKKGGDLYSGIVKRVNPNPNCEFEQTYRVLFEPEDEGYYKMQLKKGENGAKDREVLYVMTDGKIGAPLYDEQVSEEGMTLLDGSIPEREKRFRRVAFYQLRAKVILDWSSFWVPSKHYCPELMHQIRYRLEGNEWTTLTIDVPRTTLRGLLLGKRYEVQVRARSNFGWSDLSKPVLVIDTPAKPKGRKSRLDKAAMNRLGYCRDLNIGKAEEATEEDWKWLADEYGDDGPYKG